MPWINNLKLMPKLMLTFGVLLLVMLLQGIVAYRGLYSLNNVDHRTGRPPDGEHPHRRRNPRHARRIPQLRPTRA